MASRARSVLDLYQRQGARAVLDKVRTTAAELLSPTPSPRPAAPQPALPAAPAVHRDEERLSQEALAAVCAGFALRDLNLVDSLLAELEKMESIEDDADTLAQLYRLDHLATRLRRNAENLRVLSGRDAGAASEETTSLLDVIRAGLSSIEQYTRIEVGLVAPLAVVGFAADDVSRVLAELLDNATAASPPTSTVTVSAHVTERGSVLVRIEDAGIGLPPERMDQLNDRLSATPVLDRESIDHMGLAVVRRLARRYDIRAWLGRRTPHGTTASVLLPPELIREPAATPWNRVNASSGKALATGSGDAHANPDVRRVTSNGLPRRAARSGSPSDNPGSQVRRSPLPPDGSDAVRTTASGLPRRIPRSLRPSSALTEAEAGSLAATEPDRQAERERMLADLNAFAEGEQAALEQLRARPAQDKAEGRSVDY